MTKTQTKILATVEACGYVSLCELSQKFSRDRQACEKLVKMGKLIKETGVWTTVYKSADITMEKAVEAGTIKIPDYVDTTELAIVYKLVDLILSNSWTISVWDGEAFPVKRSNNKKTIIEAMFSTEEDTLVLRNSAGEKVGSIYLIYGNGEDLISDHSDNDTINHIVKLAGQRI